MSQRWQEIVEAKVDVENALKKTPLTESERKVLIEVIWGTLTIDEIAEKFGASKTSVVNWKREGLKKIKKYFLKKYSWEKVRGETTRGVFHNYKSSFSNKRS